MAHIVGPEVEWLIARGGGWDRRAPAHDPDRAMAAYRRRLEAAGLHRRLRWLADPADAAEADIALQRAVKTGTLWMAMMLRSAAGLGLIGHPLDGPADAQRWDP